MSPELPPDVALESVFIVEATYAPDAAERRRPVRAEHLARLARLRDEGAILEAGAYADMSASLLIVRAPDETAALAVAREDIYLRSGVWVELRARRFGRVVRPVEIPPAP